MARPAAAQASRACGEHHGSLQCEEATVLHRAGLQPSCVRAGGVLALTTEQPRHGTVGMSSEVLGHPLSSRSHLRCPLLARISRNMTTPGAGPTSSVARTYNSCVLFAHCPQAGAPPVAQIALGFAPCVFPAWIPFCFREPAFKARLIAVVDLAIAQYKHAYSSTQQILDTPFKINHTSGLIPPYSNAEP